MGRCGVSLLILLTLVTVCAFSNAELSRACTDVPLRDANHTKMISSTARNLLDQSFGQFLVYCWNVTVVERMRLKATCQFHRTWPRSIFFMVSDGAQQGPGYYVYSEYFPEEIFTMTQQLSLYFFLANTLQSVSCKVQPDQDNSDLICGDRHILLNDQHHLIFSIPTNHVSFDCKWLVTTRSQQRGTFVLFLDLLSLSLTYYQKLSFGSGHNEQNRSTLVKEIDKYTFNSENGTSYFFFQENLWISLSSTFYPGYDEVQTLLIRLKVKNCTSSAVQCSPGQVLCSIDSKCISQRSMCDGIAQCSDYMDEGGECDYCGASKVVLGIDESLTILANATVGPFSRYFIGFYAIYPGTQVPGNFSSDGVIVTQYKEEPMLFECVWRLTAPNGTRIRTKVEKFKGSGVVLKEGNGVHVVGGVPILVKNSSFKTISSPIEVLSSDQKVWLTLGLLRSSGYLYEMKLVFTSHNVTDCEMNEYACPSGLGCLKNASHECDGDRQCPGYGDELGCGLCKDQYLECASTRECVPRYKICNGIADCSDFYDEFQCGYCGNETIDTWPQVSHVIEHSDANIECLWTVISEVGTKIQARISEFPRGCCVTFSISSRQHGGFHNSEVIRTVDSVFSNGKTVFPTSISSNNSVMWIAKKCFQYSYSDLLSIYVHQYNDTECLPNEVLCSSGVACVLGTAVCDGLADCPEHSDEIGCGNCSSSEFICRSGAQCVSSDRICDGTTDCRDFSDEFDCGPCGESVFDLSLNTSWNITSPGWPVDMYPNKMHCLWLIMAEEGYRVVMTFCEFQTEEGYDLLHFGGGGFSDNFFPVSGQYFPISAASNRSTMYVKFTSDLLVRKKGFLLYVEQKPANTVRCGKDEVPCKSDDLVCVKNDTSERGRPVCSQGVCGWRRYQIGTHPQPLGSPGYPSSYPVDVHCIWEITARKSDSILLSIQKFETERNRDKVLLFSSSSSEKNVSFELDGTTKLRHIQFNTTTLEIHFTSDSSVTASGFSFMLFGNNSATDKTCRAKYLFDCGDGSCLSLDARCDGFKDCQIDGRDEANCESVSCPDFFSCNDSKTCIYWPMVCDGIPNCPNRHDEVEWVCESSRCPSECECSTKNDIYSATCTNGWNESTIQRIATRVKRIFLSDGNISALEPGLFKRFSDLRVLRVINSSIRSITPGAFDGLQNLTFLDISGNHITRFDADWFNELQNLKHLAVCHMPVETIGNGAFNGLKQLRTMILIRGESAPKTSVEVEKNAVTDLMNLETLYVDDHRLCCGFIEFLTHFHVNNCKTTEVQPPLNLCGSLMRNNLLRVAMWTLGLSALIGNALVIIWRCCQGKENGEKKTHSLFVLNLAISDLMMGVYMLIIAGADVSFGADYSRTASEWRSSVVCKVAGVLSVLSSEASVFFVTLISVSCCFSIMFPFSRTRIGEKSATFLVTTIWMAAAGLSIGPTVFIDSNSSEVYGLSDVCIGLPLTTIPKSYMIQEHNLGDAIMPDTISIPVGQGKQPAWIYPIVLFLGVNLLCFLVVFGCYVAIFVKVKRTVKRVRRMTHRNQEIKVALKMALIVGTDFACWMPVIILGILSQTGVMDIGPDIYAWIVVFILPINSSLNPYLYTVYTAVVSRRQNLNSVKSQLGSEMKTRSLETISSSVYDFKQS
ncbi:uncharacterized protein LOC110983148 isoform X2 [Acanthaster planci]|nr:uncharacterized protein LOC110983148 isoform X2 [Acanthaster planci]XP_022097840.1 uncharacterized protein LOC110983148 isoform X2 [Acanthaster planci]